MKRTILYVDDEIDNTVVFEAAFEDDFNILLATSGQEALEMLEQTPVPVLVADQRMPQMTGVALFEIVRQRYPHTKRILLTGYTEPEAMLDAINKGQVFQYVKKPWDRATLMSILIRALESHDLELTNSALTDRLVASERSALLGQATARVTHEMSNQLTMLPLIEMIETQYADQEELVEVARFARKMYERLVGLIDEVKAFVRFDAEQMTRQPVRLSEALHELVSFLRFDASIPNEQFTLQIRNDSTVSANKVKIQQLLVNLIKNAAYAIRDRKDGRITVTADTDNGEAVIRIEDNGCGISPENIDRIWEPNFTTKGDEGNGLGLDICKQLVLGHDGRISCTSEDGLGTCFEIRLPLLDPSETAQSEPYGSNASASNEQGNRPIATQEHP